MGSVGLVEVGYGAFCCDGCRVGVRRGCYSSLRQGCFAHGATFPTRTAAEGDKRRQAEKGSAEGKAGGTEYAAGRGSAAPLPAQQVSASPPTEREDSGHEAVGKVDCGLGVGRRRGSSTDDVGGALVVGLGLRRTVRDVLGHLPDLPATLGTVPSPCGGAGSATQAGDRRSTECTRAPLGPGGSSDNVAEAMCFSHMIDPRR